MRRLYFRPTPPVDQFQPGDCAAEVISTKNDLPKDPITDDPRRKLLHSLPDLLGHERNLFLGERQPWFALAWKQLIGAP